jgi:hypothetical protein
MRPLLDSSAQRARTKDGNAPRLQDASARDKAVMRL